MPALALWGSILSAGKKPSVPDWEDVKLTDAQKEAIKANKASVPDITDIASEVNTFNASEIERILKMQFPDYHAIQDKYLSNVESGLRGEIPKDVADLISRKSAEKAVAGGFSGSGIARNLEARDLGLTSLDLTQRAMSQADVWLARARQQAQAPLMDITSMFISPQQQFQANMANAINKFNRNWTQNQIDAMPDPKKAAIGQWMVRTDDMIFQTGLSIAGKYAGGALGGGGGGGDSGGGGMNYAAPAATFNAYSSPQAEPGYKFSYY